MVTISFVVPIRNEEPYIAACLESLLRQDLPSKEVEIIVVDGRSSDRSRETVERIRERDSRVRCLDNSAGIVPTAMNIGIKAARGYVIARADGHTIYPPDYARNCIRYLEETGADNVGGPCETVPAGESLQARLVAAVLSSPFGVGNSRFRTSREAGFVDTVPFGAFRREVFDRVGLYNEKLVRNQDNDLNARIRAAGGKIYLTPALTTYYHPASSLWSLMKYSFKNSQWHIFTLRENPGSLGLRHFVPGLMLPLFLFLCVAALFSRAALQGSLILFLGYLSAGLFFSARSRESRFLLGLAQVFVSACFHVAYGAGTIVGLVYLFGQPSVRPIRPGYPVQVESK